MADNYLQGDSLDITEVSRVHAAHDDFCEFLTYASKFKWHLLIITYLYDFFT